MIHPFTREYSSLPFENVRRNRYYGLRVGDIVSAEAYRIFEAEVVELVPMDNNAVRVKTSGGDVRKVVAEWCQLVTKTEILNPNKMNKTQTHAQKEMAILKKTTPGAIVTPFEAEILALVTKFGNSGQSGGSAPMTASAIAGTVEKLCLFQTIAPLTGEDDEWMNQKEINDGVDLYQNIRDSRVFKDSIDGPAWFLDGIIFDGDLGGEFTGNASVEDTDGNKYQSRQFIKSFPFTPKTFYVKVVDHRWSDKTQTEITPNGDWWTHTLEDISQLDAVYEYYQKPEEAA